MEMRAAAEWLQPLPKDGKLTRNLTKPALPKASSPMRRPVPVERRHTPFVAAAGRWAKPGQARTLSSLLLLQLCPITMKTLFELAPPSTPVAVSARAAVPPVGSPNRDALPRITGRGLLLVALYYALFGSFYAGTIAYTVREYQPNALPTYLWRVLLVDYPLKALWTAPVWWLLFRGPLRHLRLPWRLACHA